MLMRNLEQTVSTGRRFIIAHTVALAAVFVLLVGLYCSVMFYVVVIFRPSIRLQRQALCFRFIFLLFTYLPLLPRNRIADQS